jgi:hypothetical protein
MLLFCHFSHFFSFSLPFLSCFCRHVYCLYHIFPPSGLGTISAPPPGVMLFSNIHTDLSDRVALCHFYFLNQNNNGSFSGLCRPVTKASSREVVGEEGSKASLSCYLKGGSPTPAVSWSRAHGKRWPGGGPPPEGPTITLGKELSSLCRAQTYPS